MISWLARLTPGDWTLLIGLLANAAVMFYAMRHLDKKVNVVDAKVEKIAVATNGLQNALIDAASIAGELKGRADERSDEAQRQRDEHDRHSQG